MGEYDIIFLGYPIWWGQAPKIIYTFLESYSFSGKTIVPFVPLEAAKLALALKIFTIWSQKMLHGSPEQG